MEEQKIVTVTFIFFVYNPTTFHFSINSVLSKMFYLKPCRYSRHRKTKAVAVESKTHFTDAGPLAICNSQISNKRMIALHQLICFGFSWGNSA